MIYRVHFEYAGGSEGFQYFGNKKEALASIKDHLKHHEEQNKKADMFLSEQSTVANAYICAKIPTPKTKERILWALNFYGGHADNG
jgi:hypothetical protein